MLKRTIVGFLASLVWATVGHAQERYSDAEVAALPEYCREAFGFRDKYGNPQTHEYWRQQLGTAMSHIHHYCRGLLMINRARASTGVNRTRWYGFSVGEIDYMLRNVGQDFVLMPEMLTRRGEAQFHLKKFADADDSLRQAIELRADYWPAYLRLAESLMARKDTKAARQVLEKGIANSKETRALQKMLDQLVKAPE